MDAGFIFSKYYVCYTIFECSGYKNSQCRRQCSELSAIFQVGKKNSFQSDGRKKCAFLAIWWLKCKNLTQHFFLKTKNYGTKNLRAKMQIIL